VEGERTRLIRFVNTYPARLQVAAQHDLTLAIAFTRVVNLLGAPPALLRPDRAPIAPCECCCAAAGPDRDLCRRVPPSGEGRGYDFAHPEDEQDR
jgi:hypothetical protein